LGRGGFPQAISFGAGLERHEVDYFRSIRRFSGRTAALDQIMIRLDESDHDLISLLSMIFSEPVPTLR
jgi:hypothetical protein